MRRHLTKHECKRRPSAGFEKIAPHSKAKLDCLSFKSRVFIASIKPHSLVRLFTGSRLALSDGGVFCCGSQLGANSIRAAPLKLFRATSEKGRDNHHSLLPSPPHPSLQRHPTLPHLRDSSGLDRSLTPGWYFPLAKLPEFITPADSLGKAGSCTHRCTPLSPRTSRYYVYFYGEA